MLVHVCVYIHVRAYACTSLWKTKVLSQCLRLILGAQDLLLNLELTDLARLGWSSSPSDSSVSISWELGLQGHREQTVYQLGYSQLLSPYTLGPGVTFYASSRIV